MNPVHGKYNTNPSARPTQLLSKLFRILFKDYLSTSTSPTAPIKEIDCPHKTKQAIPISALLPKLFLLPEYSCSLHLPTFHPLLFNQIEMYTLLETFLSTLG